MVSIPKRHNWFHKFGNGTMRRITRITSQHLPGGTHASGAIPLWDIGKRKYAITQHD